MASKYAKRLDKSREHGSNHPPENGVFFWQDHIPFDHEGYVVDPVVEKLTADGGLTEEQIRKLGTAKAKPAAKSSAAPKPPKPGSKGDGEEGEGPDESEEDGLNLTMWLTGAAEYDAAEVRKVVKDRYHVWKTGTRDLVLFLVEDQKLVTPDQLSPMFQKMIAPAE